MAEHEQERGALGLADPAHPAYKQLSEASRLLDHSIQIVVVGDLMGIKAPVPVDPLKKAISLMDDAIRNHPNDVNLFVAKAGMLYALSDSESTISLLNKALSKDPNNFEASMGTHNPKGWRYALDYPSWSENATQLHPAMSQHLRLEHRVQLVRDGLQKTVAIVCKIEGPPLNKFVQTKLKWILSDTPYGPLIAWYLRIIEPNSEPSTMEAFLPIFQPTFIPMEGYCLVRQLATNPYCFLVLVQGDRVFINRKIVFSKKQYQEIRSMATRLTTTKKYLTKDNFNNAMQWHMNNFSMDLLKFDWIRLENKGTRNTQGSQEANILSEIASAVINEPLEYPKLAMVDNNYIAGILRNILIRAKRVAKNKITNVDYTNAILSTPKGCDIAIISTMQDLIEFEIMPPPPCKEVVILQESSGIVKTARLSMFNRT